MTNLLKLLITVSEKAANIARACRKDSDLFALLVQEKNSDEANARFIQDFKTLADVLIQETVRYDIVQYFPMLGKHIKGEETNIFTNTLGETIEIKVLANEHETAKLLEKVLDGNKYAASVLSKEVHKSISIADINTNNVPAFLNIDPETIGIWIDPIDSTAEYISGKLSQHTSGIFQTGLQCVTVLIGAYNRKSGEPVLGVVNQPFYEESNSIWQGKCYWGSCTTDTLQSSIQISDNKTKTMTLSKVELNTLKTKLTEASYNLVEAAGAGYKLLSVICGLADAYIVSQGTTFRWDVCGPHAVLRALGGGVYDYAKLCAGVVIEIDYKDVMSDDLKISKYCNKNGLVAVRDKDTLDIIKDIVKTL